MAVEDLEDGVAVVVEGAWKGEVFGGLAFGYGHCWLC